jgi:L-cystine uptake protein TcyP (sodium:dicarboxylate symporter family)
MLVYGSVMFLYATVMLLYATVMLLYATVHVMLFKLRSFNCTKYLKCTLEDSTLEIKLNNFGGRTTKTKCLS